MTNVRYLTVAQWGGTWNGVPATEKLADGETYVHHVGGNAWMGEDAAQVFRYLNEYAKRPKALGGKGYQFLDYDILAHYSRQDDLITIGEGRGKYRSAATLDRNEEGEAIVVCGNFQLRDPLPQEIEATALGIVYGIKQGWMALNTAIYGHRDNPAHPGATACPGDHLYAQLDVIRVRVDILLNPVPTPTPVPTVGTYVVVAGDTWYGIATRKVRCSLEKLLALNNATASTPIHPGDVIKIPTTAIAVPPDTTLWATPEGTPSMKLSATDASTVIVGVANEGRVSWLQAIIGIWPTAGVYNEATEDRIIELQEIGGIAEDGEYGEQTEQLFKIWRGR